MSPKTKLATILKLLRLAAFNDESDEYEDLWEKMDGDDDDELHEAAHLVDRLGSFGYASMHARNTAKSKHK